MKMEKWFKADRLTMVSALFLFGGFYDWNAALLGGFVCASLIMLYCKRQIIYKKENRLPLWLPEIMFIFQILASFWAVDRSANMSGIIRGLTLLLWMHACFQLDCGDRDKLIFMIPSMGEFMAASGCLALLSDGAKPFFWRAERFGGFFQYSNTCALFLFLGIAILCFKWRNEEKPSLKGLVRRIVHMAVLVLGILLTGSRSILLLIVLWGSARSVRDKNFRRIFLSAAAAVGTLSGTYYLFTGGGTQNISRIFTLLKSNSTFYGRILYDIDGVSILLQNPMGLGYSGYYYVQHMMQTGVYTTRFVHNDILQMGLDYGIIPMILLICYMAWQLAKGSQPGWKKEILAIILAASLIDFHMQYMLINFIVILCLDFGSQSKRQKRPERLENIIIFGTMLCGFALCSIAYFAAYKGRYDTVLKLMPGNTEALRTVMMQSGDKDAAAAYADKILQHNPFIADAYNVKAYAAAMEHDINSVIKNQDEVLRLEKYDADRYISYDLLLEQLEAECVEMGHYQDAEQLEIKRSDIRKQLADLRGQTNPIAYKLRDMPKYEW